MTHVWPASDAFTGGATSYGTWLGAYMRCRPWSAGFNIAHPTSGNYNLAIQQSDLSDLYSATGPVAKQATPISDPSGYLWRPLETSNHVLVSLGFQTKPLLGSGFDYTRAHTIALVLARVAGGTYTSGSNSIADVTQAYAFGLLNATTLEASWYILRITSAGAATVLASRVFTGGGLLTSELDAMAAGEIQLDCETVAGDVVLTGRVRTRAGAWTDVLTVTDSSGSKITAAGRCGFVLNGKRSITGGTIAVQSTYFEVQDTGAVSVRDEWERAWRKAAASTNDTVGIITWTGYSQCQAFGGDFHGPAAYKSLIYRSAVGGLTDRVNFDPVAAPVGSGTGAGGWLASQRRSTDKRSQNRSLSVRFSSLKQDGSAGTTNSSPHRAAGIFVRMATTQTPSSSFLPTSGYFALMLRDDAGPATRIELYRSFHGNNPTLLATADPFTINVDTDYTFRLDAYNLVDASGDNSGPTNIRVFVGGVQVVLEQFDASVSVDSAGTVTDGSATRILEGGVEGIYTFLPDGDKTIFLDTWSEGTLTNATGTAENDQASVSIPGELDDDSGATWTVPIAWPIEELVFEPAHAMAFESGHVGTNAQFTEGRRAWRCSCDAITNAERTTLLVLWAATNGVEKTFDFTVPGSTEVVQARLVDSTLGVRLRDVGINGFSVEIEEALG